MASRMMLRAFLSISSYIAAVMGQECGSIPVISNSNNNSSSPPYAEGTAVTYTCQNHYRPEGYGLFICTNGNWTGGPFSCKEVECSALVAPLHGRKIGDSYGVGSVMTFECDTGYELVGSKTMLCMSTSNWEPENVPECRIKTCPETPFITNGNTFVDKDVNGRVHVYGGVLRVECDANYMISGPVRIHCDENGHWTQVPRCEQVTCPPYEGLDAQCILRSKLEGLFLFIYCTDNATIVYKPGGDGTAYCDNGKWDDLSVRCYCHCAVNADTNLVKLENLNAEGFLEHNKTLIWSCKRGATRASTAQLKCFDGSVGTPVCTSAPTQPPTTAKPDKSDATTTTPKQDITGEPDTNDELTIKPVTTDKSANKTMATSVDVTNDGVKPGIIVVIVVAPVAGAMLVVGILIARRKKASIFKSRSNSNSNAKTGDPEREKSLTVTDANEKNDLVEKTLLYEGD